MKNRPEKLSLPMTVRTKFSIILSLLWLIFFPRPIFAAYQQCTTNSTCTVGEFLFDDSYTPITSATCTLTARNPDGTILLNGVSMTSAPQNDGWYYYDVSTTSLLGDYRARVCCTAGTDYLCLDKTFTVKAAELTAENIEDQVLDAPTSEHNTTGTIGEAIQTSGGGGSLTAADVWSYSNRSLTTFGDLITNIWNSNSRTLTTDVATQSDIDDLDDNVTNLTTINSSLTTTNNNLTTVNNSLSTVRNQLAQQRIMLEKLVNKPVVETSIEIGNTASLEEKLQETERKIGGLANNTAKLNEQTSALLASWSTLSSSEIGAKTKTLLDLIGTANNKEGDTLYAQVNWLSTAWDNRLTNDVKEQLKTLSANTLELKSRTDFYGKNDPNDVKKIITNLNNLTVYIGTKTDKPSKTTLYGYLQYLNDLNATLNSSSQETKSLLKDPNAPERQSKIKQIKTKILSFNLLSNSKVLGASSNDDPKIAEKNELLNLDALIETSRAILTKFAGESVQHIWLEEGSVIFKAIITNPSTMISQTVPLKFYLPAELKAENIIQMDSELEAKYDPEKDAYYVEGEFTLEPNESRVFSIETTDIWKIDPQIIESYKKQAQELLEPLKGTAYYGQGTTLKADIDVALNKILAAQNAEQTPQERIRTYREAQLELNGVEQKLVALQELVTEAGATGSIFGFVGGVQSVAVWGMIIIVIAGVVYLSLYMRALHLQLALKKKDGTASPSFRHLLHDLLNRSKTTKGHRVATFVFFALVSASFSAFMGSMYVHFRPNPQVQVTEVTQNSQIKPEAKRPASDEPKTTDPILGDTTTAELNYFLIKIPWGKSTNIYVNHDELSPILATITESQLVSEKKNEGEWSQVEFLNEDELETGWIKTSLLIPEPKD